MYHSYPVHNDRHDQRTVATTPLDLSGSRQSRKNAAISSIAQRSENIGGLGALTAFFRLLSQSICNILTLIHRVPFIAVLFSPRAW